VLNSDLIEFVETTPDTILTLITHKKLVVREAAEEVVRRVVAYKQRIHHYPPAIEGGPLAPLQCLGDQSQRCPYLAARAALEPRRELADGPRQARAGDSPSHEAR